MNRLFVNLYLVIILGLLSINWLSEQLWQQLIESEDSESQQLHHLEQVAKILPLLQEQQSESKESIISKLSKSLDVQIEAFPMSDFYWLEDQKEKLMSAFAAFTIWRVVRCVRRSTNSAGSACSVFFILPYSSRDRKSIMPTLVGGKKRFN